MSNKCICIAVMDRNGWKERTDIIVLLNFATKNIKWIPRDLYFYCLPKSN